MKKLGIITVNAAFCLIIIPFVSYAETGQNRSENSKNIVMAAAAAPKMVCAHAEKSAGDSSCQDTKGENKGYCPQGYPVYKAVTDEKCTNGKCFIHSDDCMKAGWGFCYTCSE